MAQRMPVIKVQVGVILLVDAYRLTGWASETFVLHTGHTLQLTYPYCLMQTPRVVYGGMPPRPPSGHLLGSVILRLLIFVYLHILLHLAKTFL